MLLYPLRHRGCLDDITGALFCSPGIFRGWFPVFPLFVLFIRVLFQMAFLQVFVKMTFYQRWIRP